MVDNLKGKEKLPNDIVLYCLTILALEYLCDFMLHIQGVTDF